MNDKKRNAKLMIAMLLGVITIGITSLSFSYAWYASSSRVEVSGVDMYIRSERDLRLSPTIDGEYKNEITNKDLLKDSRFDPCSSMYKSTWLEEKKNVPEFYRYTMPTVDVHGNPSYTLADSGLINQEFYLKVDDDCWITLDKNMIIAEENIAKNKETAKGLKTLYPDLSEEEIVDRLNSLKKCLRMAILIDDENGYQYYIIDPYKEGDTYFGGRIALEQGGYFAHYTSGTEMYETVFGEISNREKIIYDEPLDIDTEISGEGSSFNAKSKAGVHRFNYEKSIANGLEIAKEETLDIEDIEDTIIIPMYHEVPKRVVISIYMEGWDLDCTNAHMGGSFDFGLGFKIIREM